MRSTNSTPSRCRRAGSRLVPAALRDRLLDQRGFFTGNLVEPLMCIPMLSVLLLAAFMLLNDTMKSQARTKSQTAGYQHAQRSFDTVVRQLRTARSITYQAPDQTITAGWGSYGTGETNKIIANMVVTKPASVGTAPRDVTYRCYYTSGSIQYPICTRAFSADDGTSYSCVDLPGGWHLVGLGRFRRREHRRLGRALLHEQHDDRQRGQPVQHELQQRLRLGQLRRRRVPVR